MISLIKPMGVAAAAMCFVFAASAYAQEASAPAAAEARPAGGRGGRGGAMREAPIFRAVDQLTLTDEQKKQIEPIKTKANEKMQAIRTEAGITSGSAAGGNREAFQAMRPKMEELNKQTREELNKVLTPEQQKQLDEKMAEQRNRAGARRGGGGAGETTGTAAAKP